jgi:hypothetical protein
MPADVKLSEIYRTCTDETHTSTDVTHEKSSVRNNFEVRHRIAPRRICVVEMRSTLESDIRVSMRWTTPAWVHV